MAQCVQWDLERFCAHFYSNGTHRLLISRYNFIFYRFGKTISVSMFAAAMLYSTPGLELSIYSTCKRISQKLMRNVTKFVGLIYDALPGTPPMPVIRSNMEEVVLQGPDGCQDVRIVNSYPSKVNLFHLVYLVISLWGLRLRIRTHDYSHRWELLSVFYPYL